MEPAFLVHDVFLALVHGGAVRGNAVGQVLGPAPDNAIPGESQNLLGKDVVASLVDAFGILEIDGVGNGIDQGIQQVQVASEPVFGVFPIALLVAVLVFDLLDVDL